MTEEQQIEAWRKEFEAAIKMTDRYHHALESTKSMILIAYGGRYRNTDTETLWQGFLLARRSMPVIELPEFFDAVIDGCQLFSGSVTAAIEAAGYKYKIKE